MNYLDRLAKNIKLRKRKQKGCSINSFAVIGIAIGGVIAGLFVRSCYGEIKNSAISNAKDIDEDINIKRDEIKQTLDKALGESVGDVGTAMEEAFEDLEDEKQNDDEVTK